jgi:hypothetical protein
MHHPCLVIVHMQWTTTSSLFGWLVADGWCWFALREEYCWLVAGGWFVVREKYCWLVADKPSEQDGHVLSLKLSILQPTLVVFLAGPSTYMYHRQSLQPYKYHLLCSHCCWECYQTFDMFS